jgi:hypothetical protein
MKRDNFAEGELKETAEALGCSLEINFIDKETGKNLTLTKLFVARPLNKDSAKRKLRRNFLHDDEPGGPCMDGEPPDCPLLTCPSLLRD